MFKTAVLVFAFGRKRSRRNFLQLRPTFKLSLEDLPTQRVVDQLFLSRMVPRRQIWHLGCTWGPQAVPRAGLNLKPIKLGARTRRKNQPLICYESNDK